VEKRSALAVVVAVVVVEEEEEKGTAESDMDCEWIVIVQLHFGCVDIAMRPLQTGFRTRPLSNSVVEK
jgi:hypothetical protein